MDLRFRDVPTSGRGQMFIKVLEKYTHLTRPPRGHMYRGHFAIRKEDGSLDINFTKKQAKKLKELRISEAETAVNMAFRFGANMQVDDFLAMNNSQPERVDLYANRKFTPFDVQSTNGLPLRYYRRIVDTLTSQDLPIMKTLLSETLGSCIPLALVKQRLNGGTLVCGKLSFGVVKGVEDVEYGINTWI